MKTIFEEEVMHADTIYCIDCGYVNVNPDTPSLKINIDVVDQVVTLRGLVDTINSKDEAERTAKQTEGVKRVNNLLQVRSQRIGG